ncbi:MAG TPA: hypothetical protein VMU62_05720 [Acidobacteriaceae bacterium]|nr:hypothetical protein [Acidobacteriaceae bacterium]
MGFTDAIRKLQGHHGDPLDSTQRGQRRRLILQDTVALLSLLGITIVLFIITFFSFSSFRTHRQVLENRWFARGQQALASGNAPYAVEAFRSALTLSSGNRTYEIALARALAASGRTDEAFAYYSTLRDATPGDGLLNLQLARLSVKKNEPAQAIAFYRNALNGDWKTEGVARRRVARLELAQYLLSQHQPLQAQEELLTAGGNALENPPVMNRIAGLLEQSNDLPDALTAYQRAQKYAKSNSPEMLQALLGENRVAESLGDYHAAAVALERYLARAHPAHRPAPEVSVAEASLDRLQRMEALNPLPSLPPRERAKRLLANGSIAHKRFTACMAQTHNQAQMSNQNPNDLAAFATLAPRWQSFSTLRLWKVSNNQQLQDSLASLINQTEILTHRACGAPAGDDALLLQLAVVPNRTE